MKPIRKISSRSSTHPGGNAEPVLISRSMRIVGELEGDEDIIVDGRVEARISLGEHALVVSTRGRINGDVHARVICVEGHVEGDLRATDQVIVRRSGRVRGSITAPRVALDFGCWFCGTIHTDIDDGAETSLEGQSKGDNVTDIQSTISPAGAGVASAIARKHESDRHSSHSSGRTSAPRTRPDR